MAVMIIAPLDWTGRNERQEASAFGIDVFYRVSGQPGNWTLTSPGGQNYVHTPGYETQLAAKKAAFVDYERRVKASFL